MAAPVTVSRVDSLDRPRGAGRVPFMVIAAVLALVTGVLIIGLAQIDWVLVLLVPVLLLTAYFMAGVAKVLLAPRGAGKQTGRNEEE